ncbi:MAG: hypothetical protein ICV80_17985, partial [Microcoleus sp. T1-bin1]|nr:hypothetical protein [Microcoleus sp. T1-bin1]
FKDSLKNVLLGEKDPRKVAAGKAIKKFLELVEQQLKIGGLSPEQKPIDHKASPIINLCL